MKKISLNRKTVYTMVLVTLSAMFSSFTNMGGEGFEVYLNNRLLVQAFGSKMDRVSEIALNDRYSGDQLLVKYYHCGQAGQNRVITIKDANKKVLKEFRYANPAAAILTSGERAMSCNVKDILSLQKNHPGKLGLYYSSDQLPNGRLLAYIVTNNAAAAK